jgi:hypothetical protein
MHLAQFVGFVRCAFSAFGCAGLLRSFLCSLPPRSAQLSVDTDLAVPGRVLCARQWVLRWQHAGRFFVRYLRLEVVYGCVQQEFLQGTQASSSHSFARGRMTDLSLALLQDSGWYDVKYGSGGVSTHGYHAGCNFALAKTANALKDEAAKRFMCPAGLTTFCFVDSCTEPLSSLVLTSDAPYKECLKNKPANCSVCTSDFSGVGMCSTTGLENGFVFPAPVRLPSCALPNGCLPPVRPRPCTWKR